MDQAAGIVVANGRKLAEPLDGRIRPSFSLDPVLERSNGGTVDMHTGKIGGLLKAFLSGDASITVPRTPAKHYQSSLVILEPIRHVAVPARAMLPGSFKREEALRSAVINGTLPRVVQVFFSVTIRHGASIHGKIWIPAGARRTDFNRRSSGDRTELIRPPITVRSLIVGITTGGRTSAQRG